MMFQFDPLLPLWLFAALGLLFGAGLALSFVRARRILWPRAIAIAAILLIIARPTLHEDVRAKSPDIAIALIDRTLSMSLDKRGKDAADALAKLRKATPDVIWRVSEVAQVSGHPTRLAEAVTRATANIPTHQIGGIVLLTDGITADAPDVLTKAPIHQLIAGDPDLRDRRLIVHRIPAYSVVGQDAEITIRIDDGPGGKGTAKLQIEDTVGTMRALDIPVGKDYTLKFPVTRRGATQIALSVEPLTNGEVTRVNNRALVHLNGVTDRLRVLLVSGVPYPGGRVWRDILKSDANIDLVHFTILRLPTSFDRTPPEQMSLIPFPVEELFENHLPSFDLIVFDRFGLSELLSPIYFQHLADRVKSGGGLLVVTGDEFDSRGGLARTPLARLLPATVNGPVIESPFRPTLTDTGRRHPVTSVLPQIWKGGDWGRWGMQADLSARSGQVLMQGSSRPLLILDRVGKGRVGMLASTHVWWWSRGVDGLGPRDELLRRTAHWLMREPDLDENQLDVRSKGRAISITARGITPSTHAVLTDPNGSTRDIELRAGDNITSAAVIAREDGLFRVEVNGDQRFVLAGETAELSEIRPRETPLSEIVEKTGGGSYWLKNGVPTIRRVDPDGIKSGADWLGLVENRSGAIIAVRNRAMIPPPFALALIAGTLIFAWWRERV